MAWESRSPGQAAGLLAITLRGNLTLLLFVGAQERRQAPAIARRARQMFRRVLEEGRGQERRGQVGPAKADIPQLRVVQIMQRVDLHAIAEHAKEGGQRCEACCQTL